MPSQAERRHDSRDPRGFGAAPAMTALAVLLACGCSGTSATDRAGAFDDSVSGGAPAEPAAGGAPPSFTGGGPSEPPTGSTGGAGGVMAGGAGGSLEPTDPETQTHDPNVMFDWPETVADKDPCLPGTYVGQYTCDYTILGLIPGTVTGPVIFTLAPSEDGEFLEVRDGELTGTADPYNVVFNSQLVGELKCGENSFSADAQAGSYSDGFLIVGMFSGTLGGRLDRPTQTLTGTWSLGTSDASITCVGPWSAVRQP
jgi:hypothetical protein